MYKVASIDQGTFPEKPTMAVKAFTSIKGPDGNWNSGKVVVALNAGLDDINQLLNKIPEVDLPDALANLLPQVVQQIISTAIRDDKRDFYWLIVANIRNSNDYLPSHLKEALKSGNIGLAMEIDEELSQCESKVIQIGQALSSYRGAQWLSVEMNQILDQNPRPEVVVRVLQMTGLDSHLDHGRIVWRVNWEAKSTCINEVLRHAFFEEDNILMAAVYSDIGAWIQEVPEEFRGLFTSYGDRIHIQNYQSTWRRRGLEANHDTLLERSFDVALKNQDLNAMRCISSQKGFDSTHLEKEEVVAKLIELFLQKPEEREALLTWLFDTLQVSHHKLVVELVHQCLQDPEGHLGEVAKELVADFPNYPYKDPAGVAELLGIAG